MPKWKLRNMWMDFNYVGIHKYLAKYHDKKNQGYRMILYIIWYEYYRTLRILFRLIGGDGLFLKLFDSSNLLVIRSPPGQNV